MGRIVPSDWSDHLRLYFEEESRVRRKSDLSISRQFGRAHSCKDYSSSQNRKIKIETSQLDACIFQFKELGLLMFAENKKDDGHVFRGVMLTEKGERRLTLITTRLRKSNAADIVTEPT